MRKKCLCCNEELSSPELEYGICDDCAENWYNWEDALIFISDYVGRKQFFEWFYDMSFDTVVRDDALCEDLFSAWFEHRVFEGEEDAIREFVLLPENRGLWAKYIKEEKL